MNVHLKSELIRAAGGADETPLFFDSERQMSLPQLAREAAQLALALARAFSPLPERIGIFVPNSCNYPVVFYACQMLGIACVPLNIMLAPREFEMIVDDAALSLFIVAEQYREQYLALPEASRQRVRDVYIAADGALKGLLEAVSPAAVQELLAAPAPGHADSIAAVLYTSGTTGLPKGVMLTQRNLVSNALGSCAALATTSADLCYMVLPLFHSFGLTMTNMMITCGGRVWFDQKLHPHAVLDAIAQHRVTVIFLTPSFYRVLLHSDRLAPAAVETLRVTLSGGAPLPHKLQLEWRERTGHELLNGYGLTEASPVISLNSPHRWREVSIGPPLQEIEVLVCDESGRALPRGENGELHVRGPNVMKGYLNKPAETAAVLSSDGWLRTGDLAHIDDDGFIFLTGRTKDLIIYGGQNILPQEVEHALLEHETVFEVAVVGIPDETKGEFPKAFVVLKEGATTTARSLRDFLKPRIAPYKIPREFAFIDALPKNRLGKILKRELRELNPSSKTPAAV